MLSTALVPAAPTPLATSAGGLIISKLNVRLGKVELTAGELRVMAMSKFWMAFGVIGMLLGRKSKHKPVLTVDLGRVKAVARGKHGFNKKIFELTLEDGAVHRVMVDDFDRFGGVLRDQLAQRGSAAWNVAAA